MPLFGCDITIVGAGVIGLAIAAQMARQNRSVYVLEKNERFGQEISSRHDSVIHVRSCGKGLVQRFPSCLQEP